MHEPKKFVSIVILDLPIVSPFLIYVISFVDVLTELFNKVINY